MSPTGDYLSIVVYFTVLNTVPDMLSGIIIPYSGIHVNKLAVDATGSETHNSYDVSSVCGCVTAF